MQPAWIVLAALAIGCRDDRSAPAPALAPMPLRVDATMLDLAALRAQIDEQLQAGELAAARAGAERLIAALHGRAANIRELASALEVHGRALFQAGQWKDAERAIEEALALSSARTDRELRSSLLFTQGSIYAGQRRPQVSG